MTPLLRISVLIGLLGAVTACQGNDRGDLDTDADRGFEDPDRDTSGDTDLPELDDTPSFWRVDGQLTLQDGAVVAAESSITVAFTDGQGRTWPDAEGVTSTCTFEVTESLEGPEDGLDGEPLLGWWQLGLQDASGEDTPCAWTTPMPQAALDTQQLPLVVGVGEFDSRLISAMEAAGYSPSLDVYGLYLLHPSPDGDVLYIFGIAGTQDQLAGGDSTVSTPPLPNGVYTLETLVLLPVPADG